jgi:NADH dehydrogenase/NADH:ubiquinone oxidoreductase subunit G
MSETITLTIDGEQVTVPAGTTLLEAGRILGKEIPTICYHEACTSNGLCRLCVVEVTGSRVLAAACVAQASQGMQVSTDSPRVMRSRRTILELLNSAVDLSDAEDITRISDEYAADAQRFSQDNPREFPVLDDNPMYVRDYAKCVLCWRCVQVCAEDAQYTYAINFSGRGFDTQIATYFDKPLQETTCVFCGQCVGVCPTGALKPKREWLLEQGNSPAEILQITQNERRNRRKP